eukprot:6800175-Ditylum_brightwellii.AAC.1
MSMPMNCAPFLASDIVLLTMIYVSSSDAAGDAVSSLYTRQSPPITIFAYVAFPLLGIRLFFVNPIVPDPETLPGIPSASWPSVLPVDLIQ